MKRLQEMLALIEGTTVVDLTPDQNRALEHEISDVLGFDVEVSHVEKSGKGYKAFYTYFDKDEKEHHESMKFVGTFDSFNIIGFMKESVVIEKVHKTNESKALASNPYGNGYDDEPLKKGEMLTHDDGDFVEFLGISSDNKKIIVRKDGKRVEMSPAEVGVKIVEAQWSGAVDTNWTPPEGFFKKSASSIASGLKRASKDLKQAMSRLNFYVNRAGKNLSADDKAKLEFAKKLLRDLYD